MMSETVINITPQFFAERERVLVEHASLSAITFLFESGVCGLRLRNELGELVMLPFMAQFHRDIHQAQPLPDLASLSSHEFS